MSKLTRRDLLVAPTAVGLCARIVEKASKGPLLYTDGDYDYENLCKRDDLDFIYVATPWKRHAPMGIAALNRFPKVQLL